MNNLQTELKVYFEDEHTGQYSSAYYLPIVPTMTAAEICKTLYQARHQIRLPMLYGKCDVVCSICDAGEIIVERRQIAQPEDYSLFTVVDGKATVMEDDEKPQEIKLKWTLQRTLEQSVSTKNHTPSSQFFAYKLKLRGINS